MLACASSLMIIILAVVSQCNCPSGDYLSNLQ